MSGRFSPELSLLLACCRSPPSPARDAAVRAAASASIDWCHFDALVARHRVTVFAHESLRRAGVEVPQEIAESHARSNTAVARQALVMASETLRLQRMFDQVGLPAVFVKGSTLAILAYGSIALKESWDIDLLTTPTSAIKARQLLLQLGYEVVEPANLDDQQFATFTQFGKEMVFFNRLLSVAVELHWRLTDNERLLPGLNALSPTQTVRIGGDIARTLQNSELFAYLCVHGTTHGWARLKWLMDVNGLLARQSISEIERLYRAAVALGAGRTSATTLLVCHKTLKLTLPNWLVSEIQGDFVTRALVANSLYCIKHPDGRPPPYSIPSLRRRAASFFLSGDNGYLRAELRTRWTSPDDRARIGLPLRLAILYHLLRVPLWLWRLSGRPFSKWRDHGAHF